MTDERATETHIETQKGLLNISLNFLLQIVREARLEECRNVSYVIFKV